MLLVTSEGLLVLRASGGVALAAGHADRVAGGHGGLENEQAASWLLITLSCCSPRSLPFE